MREILNVIKKKTSFYYFRQVVLFIALVAAADYITGSILSNLYFTQKSGWDYETKYAVENTNQQILIFGSSRAQQQYNPTFIEDSVGLSAYNVGRDGMSFFYHYAVLQAVLARYTPKIIILDCEYGFLKASEESYHRLSPLLPFYRTHPELRPIIELRSPFEKYKLLSKTYPYNSLIFKIASGNFGNPDKNKSIKGYLPLYRSLEGPITYYPYSEKYTVDTIKLRMFNSFIKDCKKKNIQLYLVCAPYYISPRDNDQSIVLMKEIATKEEVKVLDYSKEKFFLNAPSLFDDTLHLNNKGSRIFSSILGSAIKKDFKH